ncbi:MAG: hypothetical protein AMXMBFR13_01570 [Phycisphaerae bacterium]
MHHSPRLPRIALILYWIAMFVATHLPDIDRYEPEIARLIPRLDLFVHFGMYAGWTLLWSWLLSANGARLSRAAAGWLIAGGGVYALFDELTQPLVGRETSMADYVFDVLGICAVLLVLRCRQTRRTSRAVAPATDGRAASI